MAWRSLCLMPCHSASAGHLTHLGTRALDGLTSRDTHGCSRYCETHIRIPWLWRFVYFYFMCMSVALHVSLCTMWISGALRSRRGHAAKHYAHTGCQEEAAGSRQLFLKKGLALKFPQSWSCPTSIHYTDVLLLNKLMLWVLQKQKEGVNIIEQIQFL